MNDAQATAINGVLDEIEDYLERHQDVRDGSDGTQLPNEAMSLLSDLRWWRGVIKPLPEDTRVLPEGHAKEYFLSNLQRWRERMERAGWHDELSRIDYIANAISREGRK